MVAEYILCAAIHYDDGIVHEHQANNIETGIVICGRRHHNCYSILSALTGDKKAHLKAGRDKQGFITNLNRYVGRKEAYVIAKHAGQIVFGAGMTDKENQILISENLY